MKWIQALLELLYPRKCVLCGKILEQEELDLCRKCRVEGPTCPHLHTKYPFLDSVTAVWRYEGMVRGSILRYKFQGRRHYADCYGRLLAMKLQQEQREFDLLTWIPISSKRYRRRGFDQVELLARSVGRELGMEPVRLLYKIHDNPPQSRISGRAERRANVLGVYQSVSRQQVEGKRILLLDDILTTGATAGECARVLLTAGAAEVHCAVIAAAPQKK